MRPTNNKFYIICFWIIVISFILLCKLFYIQILDNSYEEQAKGNAFRYRTLYPPRGEVFDRNGEFLVQNKGCYDLVVIPNEVKPFDTMVMARIIGVTKERFLQEFNKAVRYSKTAPSTIFKQLPLETKYRLNERRDEGFYTVYRTARSYPKKIAGNLLGYIGEVGENKIRADKYYKKGDYIGMSGIERSYEDVLRGEKGVKVEVVDALGRPQGSYMDGIYDTMPVPGKSITTTIDISLQEYAEKLLKGKIGSVVAIEPSTGEILVMASSPTYDPDLLVGRERGNNYADMVKDPRHPLFNRAVMSSYPPGSTFKIVNGLIGLEQGVARITDLHPCYGGYTVGRGVKCHNHPSPINMQQAVAMSCNAYFCFVLRSILDNRKKYKNIQEALTQWRKDVMSFGFGHKLGSDFMDELRGNVPSASYYDKCYRGRWNSLSVISLAIGQGEMGVTPLQMGNLAAILANRGFYYIPHVVKSIEGDSINSRFLEKHYTNVDQKYFEPIVQGMYDAVHKPGGTAVAYSHPEVGLCGKTGTAQNPRGADNSVFMCFAPKDNPKIAVSVYIEHGRAGATSAAPIASLLVEKYLNDTIIRPGLEDYVLNMEIAYPMYRKK